VAAVAAAAGANASKAAAGGAVGVQGMNLTIVDVCNVVERLQLSAVVPTTAASSKKPTPQKLALAVSIVKMCDWTDDAALAADCIAGGNVVTAESLATLLCGMCAFRELQKRLNSFFRAVPAMHPSLLQLFNSSLSLPLPSLEQFAAVCSLAEAPLPISLTESAMLGQLMARKAARATADGGYEGRGTPQRAVVDLAQLQRIKKGDYLAAAL
jgi:hypothetical protein